MQYYRVGRNLPKVTSLPRKKWFRQIKIAEFFFSRNSQISCLVLKQVVKYDDGGNRDASIIKVRFCRTATPEKTKVSIIEAINVIIKAYHLHFACFYDFGTFFVYLPLKNGYCKMLKKRNLANYF